MQFVINIDFILLYWELLIFSVYIWVFLNFIYRKNFLWLIFARLIGRFMPCATRPICKWTDFHLFCVQKFSTSAILICVDSLSFSFSLSSILHGNYYFIEERNLPKKLPNSDAATQQKTRTNGSTVAAILKKPQNSIKSKRNKLKLTWYNKSYFIFYLTVLEM